MRPIGEQQRTEVRNIFREVRVEPERDINFSVDVGVRVPREVHLHPLPARIVEIVPDYRDDQYFVLPDGRIVIVDAASLEIVAIIG
jgi:hypothetical protein